MGQEQRGIDDVKWGESTASKAGLEGIRRRQKLSWRGIDGIKKGESTASNGESTASKAGLKGIRRRRKGIRRRQRLG